MKTLKRLIESLRWDRTLSIAAARGIAVRSTHLGGRVSYTVHTASGDQIGRVFARARDLQLAISRVSFGGEAAGAWHPRVSPYREASATLGDGFRALRAASQGVAGLILRRPS